MLISNRPQTALNGLPVQNPDSSENVMSMPGSWRYLALVVILSVLGGFLLSCAKSPLAVDRNRPPVTYLVAAPIDTTMTAGSYSYRVHLYWRGEDPDGFVAGFLWAWDDSSITAFRFTTKTDSIFELTVNDSSQLAGGTGINPGNSRAHAFYIRAVDNLGKADPNLTIFNRRTFRAQTASPTVSFYLPIPSIAARDSGIIDTLCDGAPFSVHWFGRDPDGVVTRYKFTAGTFNSPLSRDSIAYFNDPFHPGSVSLASGLYTMSVSAIDNANAVGKNQVQFVVNHDPETWFLPKGDPLGPVGHYIQNSLFGQVVNISGIFHQGDTVPYRSTVWWEWDGDDSHGGCESNCLTGWSFNLQSGARNDGEPYNIGFLDTLTVSPSLIRFNKNDPGPLGAAGFTSLILDSLDAGTNLVAQVASRDCSNRADGTPASFIFNCNFPPTITGVTATATLANPDNLVTGDEPCEIIAWTSSDYEDGLTTYADIQLDATLTKQTVGQEFQSIIVPDRIFKTLSPSSTTHSASVRVADRAKIQSALPAGRITIFFDIP
jgi:hypothetical protein